MYPIPGVSVLFAIISFVLVMLTIFAGNKPGFMEDYHVLYFNTSTLGENLIPSLKVRAPMPEPTAPPSLLNRFHAAPNEKRLDVGGALKGAGSGLGDITSVGGDITSEGGNYATAATSLAKSVATTAESVATSVAGEALDKLSDIENDIANQLAKKLGIKEFYSIHLIDLCYGDFKPNATDPDANFNVTNCTTPFDYGLLNISALLDHELKVGPFSLNLADLGLTTDIQDKINDIPKIIKVLVSMYIIAAVCIGLGLVASIGAVLIMPNPSAQMIIIINLGLAGLAVLFLLIGNVLTTYGGKEIVKVVTKDGEKFGLSAEKGIKFLAITWATFGLMLLTVFYWGYEFFAEKKRGSEAINRAIGGFSFGPKSEPAWSETSSGLASRENSFPQQQHQGGGFPPTHAPGGMPVSPMDEVPLEDHNYGRGTHEPQPVSPLEQGGYGYPPPRF
ncbi:hypothetical protein VP1G_08116 [Cytospora mali]|uniref:SUR7 family protein pun1 n=1 Tax=Cytospora mali TaxID=578113 RepID=A0A194VAL5_CYTMA|nr:hypothetical protein VP1G_08116 [Valsa mali var. pyri (nom. inval.)]